MVLKLLVIIIASIVFSYATYLAFMGRLSMPAMFELPQFIYTLLGNWYHLVSSYIQARV